MRDCQPGAPARKCWIEARSRRIVVETFGDSDLGRPLVTGTDSNRFTQYGVDKSGASSGSTQPLFVADFFAGIGLPHADDAPVLAACAPNEDDHSASEPTDSYEAILAIIAAVLRIGPTHPGQHLIPQRHVQPATGERRLPPCACQTH